MAKALVEWTVERQKLLTRLWLEGKTSTEIARELGTTRSAVIGMVGRCGIRRYALKAAGVDVPEHKGGGSYQQRNRSRKPKAAPAILTVTGKPKAAPMPKDQAPPLVPEPARSLKIDFMELTETNCHFPSGNNPFTFCGQPTEFGKPYCPSCDARAHNPRAKPPTKAERDIQRAVSSNEQAFR